MGLPEGITAALLGHRQTDIAEALGAKQNTVSRWKTGASVPTLDDIARLDEACGRPLGYTLTAAGYCERGLGVEDAINRDTTLSNDAKAWLIRSYQAAVDVSQGHGD